MQREYDQREDEVGRYAVAFFGVVLAFLVYVMFVKGAGPHDEA